MNRISCKLHFPKLPVNCFGGSDAEITALVTGGVSDYNFDWSQGTQEITSGVSVINSLIANTYSLVVTDNNGCVDTASIVVTQPLNAIDLSVALRTKHVEKKTVQQQFLLKVEHRLIYITGHMITMN